jgi:hypothetical protein
MAASVTIIDRGAAGDLFLRVVDVTLDSSYPAGGYAISPQNMGFGLNGRLIAIDPGTMSKTGGWLVGWDHTNAKLQIFDSSGAANAVSHEVIATTVLTGVVVRMTCWGQGQG